MATSAMEMSPVLYDEQDVAEALDRQQRELARKHRKENKIKLDDLLESIKSKQALQLAGAAASGAALEGLAQATDLSEPWDVGVSAGLGLLGFAGAMWLDEHPGWASGALGSASAAVGRASAGMVKLGVDAYRNRR